MTETLLSKLLSLNPNIATLDQQPIVNGIGERIGWNCYFKDLHGLSIAGGTSADLETAKRIAVAECFERSFFYKVSNDPVLSPGLLMDDSPSTSGFAAGFDEKSTKFRSVCEAIERWAWSKWIDDHYLLTNVEIPKMGKLSQFLFEKFDSVRTLKIKLNMNFDFDFPKELVFFVFLGFRGNGVFAGSRVSTEQDNFWEHAMIEAYRNLKNYEIKDAGLFDKTNIIGERARYFGENAPDALRQIEQAIKPIWPTPTLKIVQQVPTEISGIYLFRSLCDDYVHWHLGEKDRFVY